LRPRKEKTNRHLDKKLKRPVKTGKTANQKDRKKKKWNQAESSRTSGGERKRTITKKKKEAREAGKVRTARPAPLSVWESYSVTSGAKLSVKNKQGNTPVKKSKPPGC